MKKKIIIAGGGTGGHIFPALAIANALRKADPSIDILFVGANGKMEMEKVPQAGYRIVGLDIAGFNRSSLIKNIGLPFKLLKSFMQVRKVFKDFQPDAVIGVGGYSSFPALRFAQQQQIPTYIHEANSFGGKANMQLAKRAKLVFTGSDGMEKFFPAEKTIVSGNPVRATIVENRVDKATALQFFGLQPGKKTVLVTGGSLGARSINEVIAKHIEAFTANDIQLIWQTGKLFVEQAKKVSAGKAGIWTNDFITQMENAFAAADVVISRAGAMSVAELCVVKQAVVFVPFPHAAEDHQTVNARRLVDKGAALMVKDSEAGDKLVPLVIELAKDGTKQELLRRSIAQLAIADADKVVADEILKSLGWKHND